MTQRENGAALELLAALDERELARVDALAVQQHLSREAMFARLLAVGSEAAAANEVAA